MNLNLSWYICANTFDFVKNFAVIQNVAVKSFHCIFLTFYGLLISVKTMCLPEIEMSYSKI